MLNNLTLRKRIRNANRKMACWLSKKRYSLATKLMSVNAMINILDILGIKNYTITLTVTDMDGTKTSHAITTT